VATVEDFQALDIRVGRVLEAVEVPRARKPSYRLRIDLGPLGTRRSVAALMTDYAPADLLGRQVVCVVNFPPRRVAGVESEVLVLAAVEASGRLRLLQPDVEAELGSPIS
jgi:tRNA-binding protein